MIRIGELCYKIGRIVFIRLGLNKVLFRIAYPFSHKITNKNPVDARAVIQEASSRPDGSAITTNQVMDMPAFDLQIIVPAYNAEKFLPQCLDSLLSQSTKYTFIIVLVDDGATDATGEIADHYAGHYTDNQNRIVVIHQKNRGFSGARNAGLSAIMGKFIMFVDSDDILMQGAVEALMRAAIEHNADIVEGGFDYLFYGHLVPGYRHRENRMFEGKLYGYPWGKVYRSTLFQRISFPEGFWFEDTIMTFLLFPMAERKYVIDTIVYGYRKSSTDTISSTAPRKLKCVDTYWITELMMEEYGKLSLPYDENCFEKFMHQIIVNYNRVRLMDKDLQESIFVLTRELIKKYFDNVLAERHPLAKMILENDIGEYKLYCRTH